MLAAGWRRLAPAAQTGRRSAPAPHRWGSSSDFAVNYRVVDTPVFLIPGILVLWVAAAVGAEARRRGSAARVRWGGRRLQRGRADAAALESRAQLRGERSQPGHQPLQRSFDALFHALAGRTASVHENFLVDRMVMFKLLGDESAKRATDRARLDRPRSFCGRDWQPVWKCLPSAIRRGGSGTMP